jgi:hypothetical protein
MEKKRKRDREKCQHDRQRYANMQPEQKKARIQQITENKELKRSTQTKDSIALENPAYIEPEPENPTYIEPVPEVRASTFDLKQRKHVPSSTCPAIKGKNGPGTTYNEDHGKFIKLLFTGQYTTLCKTNHASWSIIHSSMCAANKVICADNDGVIFEQDNNEDEYMYSPQGMLKTGIPYPMCPKTKDKDAPGTVYSEDHGNISSFYLFMHLRNKKLQNITL